MTRVRWLLLVVGLLCVLLIIGSLRLLSSGSEDAAEFAKAPGNNLLLCRNDAFERLKLARYELHDLQTVSLYCATRVLDEYKLRDMELRRLVLLRQTADAPVLLWMVVAITISGVALAALQLLFSYRLALLKGTALDGGGDLTIEQSRLVVKSSVTGLLILVTSFAFFLVFVLYVFRINEVDVDQKTKNAFPSGLLPGPPGRMVAAPQSDLPTIRTEPSSANNVQQPPKAAEVPPTR